MKKVSFVAIITAILLLLSASGLRAQSISHIETTGSWYYIYDQNGKKAKTLSASISPARQAHGYTPGAKTARS